MRDYENLKDITIPPEQEAIMNIVCETWAECRESDCTNCPDRPKKLMSLMECFSLKFSKKLMEVGYAPVVRCKDCRHSCFLSNFSRYKCVKIKDKLFYSDDYCSYGERKEK